jgi:hypothetical protein
MLTDGTPVALHKLCRGIAAIASYTQSAEQCNHPMMSTGGVGFVRVDVLPLPKSHSVSGPACAISHW